tara:strand:+ start:406 stop:990 length:585 start_codon:yes stop_codon:yes gene_type:complete
MVDRIATFDKCSLSQPNKHFIRICGTDNLYIDARVAFGERASFRLIDDDSEDGDSEDSEDGEIVYFTHRLIDDKINWKRQLASEWSRPFDSTKARLAAYNSMNIVKDKIAFNLVADLKFAYIQTFYPSLPAELRDYLPKFYDTCCPDDDIAVVDCDDGKLTPVLQVCYDFLNYALPINFIIIYQKTYYEVEYVV